MTYLLIGVILLVIIAPIIAILPSAEQKARMAKRRQAMGAGLGVELTSIEDPDPDPTRYLTSTGKPLPRKLSVVGYQVQRLRSDSWRKAPSFEWAVQRFPAKGGSAVRPAAPADGWYWSQPPEPDLPVEISRFLATSLCELPDDVVKVEEHNRVLVIYWAEKGEVAPVMNFLKACAGISILPPDDELDDPLGGTPLDGTPTDGTSGDSCS